jgi:anthranilate synthase
MTTASPTTGLTGLTVRYERQRLNDGARALAACLRQLDHRCGLALACDVDQPGRYQRRLIAFVDPPVAISGRGPELVLTALSPRGRLLLPVFAAALAEEPLIAQVVARPERVKALLRASGPLADESARLAQPTLLNALRPLLACLRAAPPPLGLYGTFGYDLVFQLDELIQRLPRAEDQRDLVLFLPDRLLVEDAGGIEEHRVEFVVEGTSSLELPGDTAHGIHADAAPTGAAEPAEPPADLPAGAYAALVERARERFRAGDLFEAVLSHTLRRRCAEAPSRIFARLRAQDPAPFGFLANLGAGEVLVGASPERFVRVQGSVVDSAPISGTIPRGMDAIADADAALTLLASAKDHAELTMCTDVDRNDKARICRPGSVRVVARRQIEARSRLLHTVDQVVGTLADGHDAIAALQAHLWAVTVTGAPKLDAMRFIEATEATPRRWYGGAVGVLHADGSCDTGLVLRTVRLSGGIAEVRVGATLLHASEPAAEEAETLLKAAAVLAALAPPSMAPAAAASSPPAMSRPDRRVLLVDHRDSFVHTLADYLRRLGAAVTVVRAGFDPAQLGGGRYDLVVLSPGPGTPQELGVPATIAACVAAGLPVFGVCLGLQALVLWAGGELGVLPTPMHGVASEIEVLGGSLFSGLPRRFRAGRYHSLHASRLPESLRLTARDAAGTVMAVEHRQLPLAAVQFHPESLLTEARIGLGILENALAMAAPGAREQAHRRQAQAPGGRSAARG